MRRIPDPEPWAPAFAGVTGALSHLLMAVGPDGAPLAPLESEEIPPELGAFVAGLEGVIDRALHGYRAGDRFVFGIHQALTPGVESCLIGRYLRAGWREARVIPSATGAATLVLSP